jgi:protein-disulfide isomerase
MVGLNGRLALVLGFTLGLAGSVSAQTPAAPQVPSAPQPATTQAAPAAQAAPAQSKGAAPAAATPAQPLKLYSLGSETQADPFPPVNPKFFTADSPSVATVENYLKTMLGFDPNRIWRVMAIQKTAAPGVSKVTALISERGTNSKVLSAVFFVMPDGKHLISSDASGVSPFGAEPFEANRSLLQAKADGPFKGSESKDLMLVEFADLQCPHCKDAQATMDKLAKDFPKARIVFENFPLTEVHPYALQAATYGACVAKQSNDAFFTYAQAVYDTQGALLPETADATLKAAVTKAGLDPAAIATCAAGEAAKADVNAAVRLGEAVGVDQTPMLAVNGRLLSISSVPYETLKQLIVYQASLNGVSAAAASPDGTGVNLKP